MANVIRDLDNDVDNDLPVVYVPFSSVGGLIAAWRIAEGGLTDLSGNGHTLTAIGSPILGDISIKGDQSNGYQTNVPDALERTIIAVFRHSVNTDSYGYPIGNLRQQSSTLGVGFAIQTSSSTASSLKRCNVLVGNTAKNSTLLSVATGPADSLSSRMNFTFIGGDTSGSANLSHMYYPLNADSLQAGVLASGANLATRGIGIPYKAICWEDISTPAVAATGIEVTEILIYDHALTLADYQSQYAQSKAFHATLGISI